jgi:predicted nucleic acid-binding protein
VIVLDTSGVLAAIDASQRDHRLAAEALRAAGPPRLLSPFVLAELDYLLATRVSTAAAGAFLAEVAAGAYQLESIDTADVGACLDVIERYRDLALGIADASVVVLAARHGTHDLLTLDERHFRAVTALDGRPFRMLPADVAAPAR